MSYPETVASMERRQWLKTASQLAFGGAIAAGLNAGLGAGGGVAANAANPANAGEAEANPSKRPLRVAAINSVYRLRSHAYHLCGRVIHGYQRNGFHHQPRLKLVRMHNDQKPVDDLGHEYGKRYGVEVCGSVEAALGGPKQLDVDAVLLVIEHGDYPVNEWNQVLYPRYEMFAKIVEVFRQSGRAVPDQYDMSSLRILGTVGEPINPEAWMWYRDVIGANRCPVVDTWWQTETGGVMISPLPGATPTKPGSCTLPLPGIVADIVDHDGNSQPADAGGYLAVRRPWPGMMRTVHGDPERFRRSYWEEVRPTDGAHLYFAGDGARRDADGYFWVMGRVDDVINVSGHRLGTMEIESALVSHPAVAEAAVVGRPDDLKGEGIVAFVTLEAGRTGDDALVAELRSHVGKEIGPIARPDLIRFSDALPKTRSGKIMRRILRSLASGQEVNGDTSTLEDRSVLDQLRV